MSRQLLRDLLPDMTLIEYNGDLNVEITGIAYDSRKVQPGNLFVAIRGARENGLAYVEDAVARGAAAVLSGVAAPARRDIPWMTVADERVAMARMACRFYGIPIEEIQLIGVTGTNGKTTVTGLLAAILDDGGQVARVGTLGMTHQGRTWKSALTTPEAVDLFAFLAEAGKDSMPSHLVMEVSSVAMVQRRLAGMTFDQAIFTSFSGDHLDVHGDMESYFSAKLSFFRLVDNDGWAIINYDDPRAEQIIENLDCRYLTFGFSRDADVRPLKTVNRLDGTQVQLLTPKGTLNLSSSLLGRVNVYNLMAAVASAQVAGVDNQQIEARVRDFGPVRGRMERVTNDPVSVMIDYAHTDDALKSMLVSVRELCKGRLILVFGAGGDRDRSKRPRMGSVAAGLADWVILTNDNPRTESPQDIARDVLGGFPDGFAAYEVVLDRRQAIARAIEMARPEDLVVVAGKGHEDYQIFKDRTEHFDDREVILECMNKWQQEQLQN